MRAFTYESIRSRLSGVWVLSARLNGVEIGIINSGATGYYFMPIGNMRYLEDSYPSICACQRAIEAELGFVE